MMKCPLLRYVTLAALGLAAGCTESVPGPTARTPADVAWAHGDDTSHGDSAAGDLPLAPDGGDTQGSDGQAGSDANAGDSNTGSDAAIDGDTDVAGDSGGDLKLPAYLVAFGVPSNTTAWSADGGEVWVDVRINDVAALGSDWRLMMATYTYVIEQLRGSELPWALSDGDLLRFHGPDCSFDSDAVMADNNPDRWDVRGTEPFSLNIKHGFLWVETADGRMLDGVAYDTGRNTGNWLGGVAATAIADGVSQGAWDATTRAAAFMLPHADVEYGRLREPSRDGASAADWEVRGRVMPDYYVDAHGKTGAELKLALNRTIRGHTVVAYAELPAAFHVTDRDPNDSTHVIDFYTGQSTLNDFNREHIWAKSHGGFGDETYAGYSDLHHLRPARADVNSARWHLDFDNGGELYSDSGCRVLAGISFEPRDAVKGDVARMMFYMAVRYEGGESNMPDLELVEAIPSLLDSQGNPNNNQHMSTPHFGRLSTLLTWHAEDPPDAEERRRNEVIFTDYQTNRNPFIDHPEWVAEIWGGPAWPGD